MESRLSLHLGIVAIEKESFGSYLTTVTNFTYFYIYIYIYIYMCVCVCVCVCVLFGPVKLELGVIP